MNRPNFNANTEVKVVNKSSSRYGKHGIVICLYAVLTDGTYLNVSDPNNKEKLKAAYNGNAIATWGAIVRFAKFGANDDIWYAANEIELV